MLYKWNNAKWSQLYCCICQINFWTTLLCLINVFLYFLFYMSCVWSFTYSYHFIFFMYILTNILEHQKDLYIEETTSKSTAKNLLHQLWKGRNTNTNHSLGAHYLYLFQSWCQIRRELLALPACIIPEFFGTCCL